MAQRPVKPPAKKTPSTKQVPEAGETVYVVVNPSQVEKMEEAIKGMLGRVSFAFPEAFWVRFYAGCYAAAGSAPEGALQQATKLVNEIKKKGKKRA